MDPLKAKLKLNEAVKTLFISKEKIISSENFQIWIKNCEEAKIRFHQLLIETDFKNKVLFLLKT